MRAIASLLLAVLIVSLLGPTSLYAGAWTQDAGHGQIILTASFFQTSRNFDDRGGSTRFADNASFRQLMLNPFLEYGMSRRNTLVVNANVPFLRYASSQSKSRSAGLGDVEIGIKRRLNSLESKWALSGQLAVMFPAYPDTRLPAPGNHQEDIEGRMMAGRNATLLKHHAFWTVEGAYRYRNGAPADQARAEAVGGADLSRRLTVMAQFFAIKSLRNGMPLPMISNPNSQSDFDLYKYQPSVAYRLSRNTLVQFGANSAFSGRNTGRGLAPMFALWQRF